MKLSRAPVKKARIEIIPLIDTVFFLLVFFMMSSLSMAVYHGLPVNLPHAASGAATVPDNASITVTRDGATFLGREPVPVAGLAGALKPRVEANPSLSIIVNADAGAVHGRVVAVLDAVRKAGATRLAIAITPEAPR